MKEIYKKIAGFLLLMIFFAHFASITFFTHTHIIDGATIVHSHPYKSQSGSPVSHDHSKNGIRLTHFISNLIITAAAIFIGIAVFRSPLNNRLIIIEDNFCFSSRHFRTCLPRAPSA